MTDYRKDFPVLIPKNKKEARLAIARDIIRHVKSHRLMATRGVYLSVHDWDKDIESSFEQIATSLQAKDAPIRCDVCGIGAACMVAVGLYDDAPELEADWNLDYTEFGHVSNIGVSSADMKAVLNKWFSPKQLDLIECAFEETTDFRDGKSSKAARIKAAVFCPDHSHSGEAAMEAIYQNIIDNDGTFKP